MAFSEHFLDGLATKSEGFQNEFFGIMDMLYSYLEYDDEKVQKLEKIIEEEVSYYEKGNILWWGGSDIGGELDSTRSEEYFNELCERLAKEFVYERTPNDDGEFELANGTIVASNIIIATEFPEEAMTEEAIDKLEFLIYLNRLNNPPRVTIINNPNAEYASYRIVTMS